MSFISIDNFNLDYLDYVKHQFRTDKSLCSHVTMATVFVSICRLPILSFARICDFSSDFVFKRKWQQMGELIQVI